VEIPIIVVIICILAFEAKMAKFIRLSTITIRRRKMRKSKPI